MLTRRSLFALAAALPLAATTASAAMLSLDEPVAVSPDVKALLRALDESIARNDTKQLEIDRWLEELAETNRLLLTIPDDPPLVK